MLTRYMAALGLEARVDRYNAARQDLVLHQGKSSLMHHPCEILLFWKPPDTFHQVSVAFLVVCHHPAMQPFITITT